MQLGSLGAEQQGQKRGGSGSARLPTSALHQGSCYPYDVMGRSSRAFVNIA